MLPMKYVSNLNTDFQFDWIPNYVTFENKTIFPKFTTNAVSARIAIGAFNNRFYGDGLTSYDDLPSILHSDYYDSGRYFEAKRYSDISEVAYIRDRIYKTYTLIDTDAFFTSLNMTKAKIEDLYYNEYPDYPSVVPRSYRYQDCYWLRSTSDSTYIRIDQVIAYAVYLFYNLPDITSTTLDLISHIGFTFLYGNIEYTGQNKCYLNYMDPMSLNPDYYPTRMHYGFGGYQWPTAPDDNRPYSRAVVLKDFTKSVLGTNIRHTIVAVKGAYNWVDNPFNTQLISQPYLNFGYDGVPANGKLLMFGAEYFGERN